MGLWVPLGSRASLGSGESQALRVTVALQGLMGFRGTGVTLGLTVNVARRVRRD